MASIWGFSDNFSSALVGGTKTQALYLQHEGVDFKVNDTTLLGPDGQMELI